MQETAFLGDVLAHVLPADDAPRVAFPGWDERREYTATNCDVFYRSHVSAPLALEQAWTWAKTGSVGTLNGAGDSEDSNAPPAPRPSGQPQKWVRVPPATPLDVALSQPNHVIPDIPVFYVIARSSRFYAALREKLPGGVFAEVAAPRRAVS